MSKHFKIPELAGLLSPRELGRARPLPVEFFDRDPRAVARELLGKLLIRKTPGGMLAGRVVETEAYLGEGDLAAHAVSGKTARNFVLWGPPGHAYVYFIYGNHYCLNVSCLPDGVPGCVLFRALEPVAGIEKMAEARGISLADHSRHEEKRRPAAKTGAHRTRIGTAEALHPSNPKAGLLGNPAVPFPKLTFETTDGLSFGLSDLKRIASGPGRMCEALGITRARDNGKSLISAESDLRLVDDGFQVERPAVTKRIGITKSAEEPLRYLIGGNSFVSGSRV